MLARVSHNHNVCKIILVGCFDTATKNPMVTISGPNGTSNSITVPNGTNLEIMCNVSVVENLVSPPTIEWRRGSDSGTIIVNMTHNLVVPLTFHPLLISHGDIYFCVASINIESVSLRRKSTNPITIKVQSECPLPSSQMCIIYYVCSPSSCTTHHYES